MMHNILFSGHMIDRADSTFPSRFSTAGEPKVKSAISTALKDLLSIHTPMQGIASGACGGDILFLEACLELGIPATMYLPHPPAVFKQRSVDIGGPAWVPRFDHLLRQLPVYMLEQAASNTNVYKQVNDWMLKDALANGREHMTLLVVWDGIRQVGKGGTASMVETVEAYDVAIRIIAPR